ncbi:enoyl-CoA hydratase [Chelatococcus reniformis]|uniref:Enoyl-CoA hydratase n=1 Tax=Chelatococcus reniformis TaxID=1494448 RepID=A0A916X8X1_9HYPH|nr:enoyl-CoA hydratase [Chelatococcus reniformis]GGC51962.1 enoyl-CoA hydratase [Chelatococcus reniformis]
MSTDLVNEPVVLSRDGAVVTVRLNRPDKKNALTQAMYEAMTEALAQADRSPDVRVLVITGTADSFTAGNDLKDFLAAKPGEESAAFRFVRALPAFSKPLVAAVNGLAVGVGTTMLLHCDFVYAADTARFQLPFVSLGIVPEAASSLLLPRLAGHQAAAELLLLGDFFDAEKARGLGIVNAVVPATALEETVRAVAGRLAAKPPGAVRATKALMKSTASVTTLERMGEEGKVFEERLHTPEAREAMAAVLERRPPDFSKFG